MRLSSICSEAMRNIAAGTARAFTMFLAVLLTGTLLGGFETLTVVGLENQARMRIDANADVKTLVGGQVDGVVADRLAGLPGGPTASGAMRKGPQVTPLATPGKDLASWQVTPGLLRLLAQGASNGSAGGANGSGNARRQADANGVWVSDDLAHDFGLTVGGMLDTDQGKVRVAGTFAWPNDGRDTRFAYSLVVPVSASDGTFEEAWAKQWPVSDELDVLLYSTAVVSGGEQAQTGVTSLNKGFDAHYDAAASYRDRMSRWMPWVALCVGMLLGALSVRRRRLEYAAALHSGESKGAQLLGLALETLVWAGLGALCSAALLAAGAQRLSSDGPWQVFLAAARAPMALFAGTLLASLVTGLAVRESNLFRLFKTR